MKKVLVLLFPVLVRLYFNLVQHLVKHMLHVKSLE